MSFYIAGLYTLTRSKNNRSFFTLLLSSFAFDAALSVAFFYFVPYVFITPKVVLFIDLGITVVLLILWRAFYNSAISTPPRNIAFIGSGKEIDEIMADIARHPQQGFRTALHIPDETHIGSLYELFRRHEVDIVAVETDYRNAPELAKNLFSCLSLHIQFFDFVDFYEQYFQKIPLAAIDRAWFLVNMNETGKILFSFFKRGIDIIIALILAVLALFLTPFIVAAVLLESGRPLFFSQMRVGKLGNPFRIHKFRTLRKENDDATVTKVGAFLRATHLDEIPQLWNILKGEMSFVGPRPEQVPIVDELKKRVSFYEERLLVRPGITGWAQLHEPRARAEDALAKLQYDLFYIKNRSFLLDAEIIVKTIRLLLP
ncbi:sugar transferase [Candidatus Peregrinibacteria bacterium]|nr:sugar transferase [Candidatus Peregrinibacteria bacterium]